MPVCLQASRIACSIARSIEARPLPVQATHGTSSSLQRLRKDRPSIVLTKRISTTARARDNSPSSDRSWSPQLLFQPVRCLAAGE